MQKYRHQTAALLYIEMDLLDCDIPQFITLLSTVQSRDATR
jgi:hypothetical protein